jgi:HK97 family phage portal protein
MTILSAGWGTGPWSLGRTVVPNGNGGISLPPPGGAGVFGLPGPYVYDATSARRIPAVGRALQLYAGLVKQMPMDAYRGYGRVAPTPRLLQRPDPMRAGSWYVQVNVEDYLLAGNAVSYVTSRGADGWPLSVAWLPVNWVSIVWDSLDPDADTIYTYLGQTLNADDVIHVRRGADRLAPVRGVGVVEEYLSTLDRVAMEEEYERSALAGGAVPSVAVTVPQASPGQTEMDDAKARWLQKFSGPQREPVFLPAGTVVTPLGWSPTDAQLAEARRLSLLDVANMFNLDGYWLGAPVAGMTYRTAGPQYQQVLRTSLEPLLADLEDVWSAAWLPRGTNVRFRRDQLLRDDLATTTTSATALLAAGIITQPEARVMLGLPPHIVGATGAGADIATPSGAEPAAVSPDDPNADTPGGTDAEAA